MTLNKSGLSIVLLAAAFGIGIIQLPSTEQEVRALTDPIHCDKSGWPSCYSLGFEAGQNDANNNYVGHCGHQHSEEFCRGYYDGVSVVRQ